MPGCMFAVLEGEVEIRKGDRVLETLGEGSVFGELALMALRILADRLRRHTTA